MTLEELIRRFRTEANDKAQPYFWSDEELKDWLNDAQDEAAIRGRLIHDSSTAAVCSIDVTAGVSVYALHESLYEITSAFFQLTPGDRRIPIYLVSVEYADRTWPDWREPNTFSTTCSERYAIQDDATIRLVPTPTQDGVISLECYRLPMVKLVDNDDEPGIHKAHHRHLIQWALHKAFSIPDTEAFDATRAGIAEAEFTRYFGIRPDSDLRRSTRFDETQVVRGMFP